MPPVLAVDDLTVEFRSSRGIVRAVNGVSYAIEPGETLGIVGESGSGKSAHVLAMARLLPSPPAFVPRGRAVLDGQDLLGMDPQSLRRVRGAAVGFVFQDPMTSLNPVLTVGRQVSEPLVQHRGLSERQARERAAELLDLVGIADPRRRLDQYPHQFSGGMRQRVMFAMAIACEPRLLIADEPTTALDVTVQAQILDLIESLKQRLGMAILWITHDLAVLARIADTIQVMYAGRIVERGPARAVFKDPRNAYTLGLLQSLPAAGYQGGARRLTQIRGAPPDLANLPPGDPFAPRNAHATERCLREMPPLRPVAGGDPRHLVAAWYDLRAVRR